MIRLSRKELIRHVVFPGILYIILFFGGSEIIEHVFLNQLEDSTIHVLHFVRGIFSVCFVVAAVLYSLWRAEETFNRRMEAICGLLNVSNKGIIAFDSGWDVVSLNPQARQMLGDINSKAFSEWVQRLRKEFHAHTEYECFNPTEDKLLRIDALQSHPNGSLLMLHDATTEKKQEEKWLVAEKMASVGRMAAGLAHEIGTPLNIISGRAELIEQMQANICVDCGHYPNCGVQKHIRIIFDQIERISGIIRQLLTQTREPVSAKQYFDMNTCVERVAEFLQPVFEKHSITLQSHLQKNLPNLYGFPDQFQQVLINLMSNSVDAMESKGGRIQISTKCENDHVELRVADEGCGISQSDLTRIFDPFFTTKEFGKGTGLGLTVTSNIVRAHGGTIDVRTKPNQGTEFTIHLPVEASVC
jgi:signal transduction histidine kinase